MRATPRGVVWGLICAAALPAFAAGIGLKPGLWEVQLTKQVVDGQDRSTQLAASLQRMQQAMANLPPERRARMEAMMQQSGISPGSNGGFRICVSPEMAQRDAPILDKDGHCQPATVTHHGNVTNFQFSCTTNGVTTSGHGDATAQDDVISTHTDVTTRSAGGTTHMIQNESNMHYLGADCGTLKPPELPAHP